MLHEAGQDNWRCRMTVEVAEEASQIKFRSISNSFDDFDRCIYTWCVMNGCSRDVTAPSATRNDLKYY